MSYDFGYLHLITWTRVPGSSHYHHHQQKFDYLTPSTYVWRWHNSFIYSLQLKCMQGKIYGFQTPVRRVLQTVGQGDGKFTRETTNSPNMSGLYTRGDNVVQTTSSSPSADSRIDFKIDFKSPFYRNIVVSCYLKWKFLFLFLSQWNGKMSKRKPSPNGWIHNWVGLDVRWFETSSMTCEMGRSFSPSLKCSQDKFWWAGILGVIMDYIMGQVKDLRKEALVKTGVCNQRMWSIIMVLRQNSTTAGEIARFQRLWIWQSLQRPLDSAFVPIRSLCLKIESPRSNLEKFI